MKEGLGLNDATLTYERKIYSVCELYVIAGQNYKGFLAVADRRLDRLPHRKGYPIIVPGTLVHWDVSTSCPECSTTVAIPRARLYCMAFHCQEFGFP